jgi:hypothetical protein
MILHMQNQSPRSQKRAAWIFSLVVMGFVGFILWFTVFSNGCARVMGIETYPLTGDVRHFKPFKELGQIRAKAGPGAVLTEIEASYVRSDGTMDLKADYTPAPTVEYTFYVPAKPPENLPPVGVAGRTAGDAWFQRVRITCGQIGQVRSVTRMSGGSRSSFSYANEGMEIDRDTPQSGKEEHDLGDPKLSCADLWAMAMKKGAPKDAVAVIRYRDRGYEFSISGSVSFELDASGKPR